ncbi:MAG: MFS transporter [Actinomyces sp.]|nr:MAG: MFS transporter [Actinomyces sp.]
MAGEHGERHGRRERDGGRFGPAHGGPAHGGPAHGGVKQLGTTRPCHTPTRQGGGCHTGGTVHPNDPAPDAPLAPLDERLLARLAALDASAAGVGARPDPEQVRARDLDTIFEVQVRSRCLDHAARHLREQGRGWYTIASAGHESNALVARALRPSDPALLHYRSGAFYLERARQAGHDGTADVLEGLVAAADEPIAGGRHKVFGHPELAVIPQTSTIASHLPRALGLALALDRARRLGLATPWPPDAVVVCSFGDASVNHATARAALNATAYARHRGLKIPLLYVCEDNGLGISVPSPPGWVATTLDALPGIATRHVDGDDPLGVAEAADELVAAARAGRPGVLHLATVRFLGHAGADVESAYRHPADIRRDEERDPIVATARLLVGAGLTTAAELVERYRTIRAEILTRATHAASLPPLRTRAEVMAPLAPRSPDRVAAEARRAAPPDRRRRVFTTLPEDEGPLTLAESVNRTLTDLLAARPEMLVFGEDVAVKGGVYGVTRGLARRFGGARVFDTLLDETSILGLGLGAGLAGFLPVPEIQYLAYLHNAEDQIRGEAATASFFSRGAYRNPLVVRVAAFAYQRGFGGHFHNDDAVAVLRDIPGIVVAAPAHPADAPAVLRTCVAAAAVDGTVSVLLEPIAAYHERDLHEPGDGLWTAPYEPPARWGRGHVPIGEPLVARPGDDVCVVTFANGRRLAERVARRWEERGVGVRVLDVRWLVPLPHDEIARHAREVGRVVVADETRESGGVGEGIVTGLVERGFRGPLVRVSSADSFVPLGPAAELVLLSEDDIDDAIRRVLAART